jgi:hypothetical protein
LGSIGFAYRDALMERWARVSLPSTWPWETNVARSPGAQSEAPLAEADDHSAATRRPARLAPYIVPLDNGEPR